MPGRSYTGNAYRYGFNGKEKDDEVSGKGSILSFEYRIFDSRLCRWLTTDPWENKYSWQTPYAYFKNSPIAVLDYLGRGEYYGKDGNWIASDGQKDDKVFHADENGTVKFGVGILKEFMFTEWDYQVKDEKLKEFLPELIKNEGGYNDRKNDKGGKTNYGITWAAWKLHSKQLLGVQPTVSNLKHISKKTSI